MNVLLKYGLLIAMIFLIFSSCNETYVGRAEFKETKILSHPEIIDIPLSKEPYCVRLIKDSIIVVNNDCWNNRMLLELYSLKSKKRLAVPIVFGEYKQGIPNCKCFINSNTSDLFRIQLGCECTVLTVSIDSLLKKGYLSYISKFGYLNLAKRYYTDVFLTDKEHYVAYNAFYVKDSLYNNGFLSPLLKEQINPDSLMNTERFYINYKVNGSCLFVNPKTGKIWSADFYRDEISIFNDNLEIERVIKLGDCISPVCEIDNTLHSIMPWIRYKGKNIRTFIDYFVTSRYIYLAYIGKYTGDRDDVSMEILKLDMDGNFICDYITDRLIHSISIDISESNLYCLSYPDKSRVPVLLRYKL